MQEQHKIFPVILQHRHRRYRLFRPFDALARAFSLLHTIDGSLNFMTAICVCNMYCSETIRVHQSESDTAE